MVPEEQAHPRFRGCQSLRLFRLPEGERVRQDERRAYAVIRKEGQAEGETVLQQTHYQPAGFRTMQEVPALQFYRREGE
jgi:hypothetical protein